MAEALTKNSTYEWFLTATKDGVVWDLTGATVTLLLLDPDGTTATKSASLVVPASGTAKYVGTTTDLPKAGNWSRAWRVVQGVIDVTGLPIPFTVIKSP